MAAVGLQVDPLAFKLTVWITFLLFVKLFFTLSAQGGARFKAGTRPPEDGGLAPAAGKTQAFVQQVDGEGADSAANKAGLEEMRWTRIVANDLENIPLGLLVAWSSLLASGAADSGGGKTAHIVFVIIFLIGRIGHTLMYARGVQPWRTVFWTAATIAVFGLGINSVVCSFNLKEIKLEL